MAKTCTKLPTSWFPPIRWFKILKMKPFSTVHSQRHRVAAGDYFLRTYGDAWN